MSIPPFHLAFPVQSIKSTRRFYVEILGCDVGREDERWIDFNFFGHQITAHLAEDESKNYNQVDNRAVPTRHFGAILAWEDWHQLVKRVRSYHIEFYIEPYTRFKDQVGEQRTFFIQDPSQNYLEFKSFRDSQYIFISH
ncbi:MAG: VOC family protein [Pseudomonadota bacterium]